MTIVALPSNIISALSLVRLASHWMFAFLLVDFRAIFSPSPFRDAYLRPQRSNANSEFYPSLTGACTCFVSIFLTPLSIFSRWATFPIAIFAFLSALTTTAATIVATVMFIIFKKVIHSAEVDVNIVPEIGIKMFAFMWIASVCSILGWLVQVGLCCCCASRRDIRLGKKMGRKKAWRRSGEVPPMETRKREKMGFFGRKKES